MPIFHRQEKKPLGIYVHIPFCHSKCKYCDFYSVVTEDGKVMDEYLRAVCAHIKESGSLAPNHRVDTVYFGGGTPSFFGAERVAAILTAVRQNFDVSPQAEITFEANPDSITAKLLRRLKSEGFNRVSLGIQSDDDDMLARLGRPHTFEDAVVAVERIRKAGFRNLSVDLMYGLPEQTMQGWGDTLNSVLALQPDHISLYALKMETGTPLYAEQDRYHLPDDDTQVDMYLAAVEYLKQKHYRQYEISNFAHRGMASRHNLKYWMCHEYLGFGPAASSDFGGKRFTFVRNLREYIDGIHNHGAVIDEMIEVPPRDRAGEYVMMRMRTTMGINREDYEKQYLLPFDPLETVLEKYAATYHAIKSDGRWRLSPTGMMISNTIIVELLEAQERTVSQSMRR